MNIPTKDPLRQRPRLGLPQRGMTVTKIIEGQTDADKLKGNLISTDIPTNQAVLAWDGGAERWAPTALPTIIISGHIAGDDHTDYAKLGGRPSGQTFRGGNAASENLTLDSTIHATKGVIILGSPLRMAASANNIIQDSGGATRIVVATTSPHLGLGSSAEGTVVTRVYGQLGVGTTPSTSSGTARLVLATWRNLGGGNSTMFLGDVGGVQTANAGIRTAFSLGGTAYDLNGFNLTTFQGMVGLLSVQDGTSSGATLTNGYAMRAAYNLGLSDFTINFGQTVGYFVEDLIGNATAGTTVTNHAGVLVNNQAGGASITFTGTITTASVGVDVVAQARRAGATHNAIGVRIGLADTYSLQLSSTAGTAASGITFGTDTVLYRSAADTLRTDDDFIIGDQQAVGSAISSIARANFATWTSLSGGTSAALIAASLSGLQSASGAAMKAGVSLSGTYDINGFNLTNALTGGLVGVRSNLTGVDSLGGGTMTLAANFSAGQSHGQGGSAITITDSVYYFAEAYIDASAGANAITTHRAFWAKNQGHATVTTAIGLDIEAQSGSTNTIGFRNAATSVYTPTTQTLAAAGNTILADRRYKNLDNSTGASLTLISTPTIANGQDGQYITLINVDSADNIVLQNETVLAGSNLRLAGAANLTLGPRDSVTLMFSSALGDWIQTAASNN